MLRLPSAQEIADLFFTPSTVNGAVAMLDRAKARVAVVAKRAEMLADTFRKRAGQLRFEAAGHDLTAKNHQEEAARALRVHDRLGELLA